MSLRINDLAPDFTARTTQGEIQFHHWLANSWALLFSHPKDFTPVCTTELVSLAELTSEFSKRQCKVIGLSIDDVEDHILWLEDIETLQGIKITYPMIADDDLQIAKQYDMLSSTEPGSAQGRTAESNATVRCVFLIAPDKTIRMILTYPMTTGRNFDEILRVLDAIQLTSRFNVATPANWHPGDDVIILPTIDDDEARLLFPAGFNKIQPYLRTTRQPWHH